MINKSLEWAKNIAERTTDGGCKLKNNQAKSILNCLLYLKQELQKLNLETSPLGADELSKFEQELMLNTKVVVIEKPIAVELSNVINQSAIVLKDNGGGAPNTSSASFASAKAFVKTTYNYDYYLVTDLEMTCVPNKNDLPDFEMETIEIGCAVVSTKTLEVVDTFETVIRPVLNPELHGFCVDLTGIQQKDVDAAETFPVANSKFMEFLKPYSDNSIFVAWGTGDHKQLEQDAKLHQVEYCVTMPTMNLKSYFSALGFAKKGFGLKKAMNILGIHQDGAHRALVDALNTAKLIKPMLDKAEAEILTCGGKRLLNKNQVRSIGVWVSKLLRHEPSLIGAEVDSQGWMSVESLLKGGGSRKEMSLDALKEVVEYDGKGRMQFSPDGNFIRCLQGHSLPHVMLDFKPVEPEFNLYHGTCVDYLPMIKSDRYIKSMKRNMLHLSSNVETALDVGGRHGKPVVFEIDVKKLMKLGHQFFLSENGVYLSSDIPLDCAKLLK